MLIKTILETMALLVKQHKELNKLSLHKTDLIKANNIEELKVLLKEESKLVRMMEETEKARQGATAAYLDKQGVKKPQGTVTMLLEYLPSEYQQPLRTLQKGLLQEMRDLREREAMNRMLLEDSLHFVQMTLDMIQPDPEAVHYTHPENNDNKDYQGYSVFDSKA